MRVVPISSSLLPYLPQHYIMDSFLRVGRVCSNHPAESGSTLWLFCMIERKGVGRRKPQKTNNAQSVLRRDLNSQPLTAMVTSEFLTTILTLRLSASPKHSTNMFTEKKQHKNAGPLRIIFFCNIIYLPHLKPKLMQKSTLISRCFSLGQTSVKYSVTFISIIIHSQHKS